MESIITYLLIKGGHHKMTEWQHQTTITGHGTCDNGPIRIENHVFKKLQTPVLDKMSFVSKINKAKRKKVLGSNLDIYLKLIQLRKLRDRVHLQIIDHPTDTDWNAFGYSDLCDMAQIIHSTFTGKIFYPSQREREYFIYLEKYLDNSGGRN